MSKLLALKLTLLTEQDRQHVLSSLSITARRMMQECMSELKSKSFAIDKENLEVLFSSQSSFIGLETKTSNETSVSEPWKTYFENRKRNPGEVNIAIPHKLMLTLQGVLPSSQEGAQ